MNKNIEHYFFRKENFLEESYCENCINELSRHPWKKHEWYRARSDTLNAPSGDNEPEVLDWRPSEKRLNMIPNVEKINTQIIQKLHSTILEYIVSFKFDWFNGWEGYSGIKFMRYYPGQTMQNHCDHIRSMFDGERKGVPILSIIGLLNDTFEGGELIMFEDKKIDIKKGDLVIFPSNFLYPHKINPLTKGIRYSYQSWVW